MKVLAVETATSWQSVAILDESRVLARHDQEAAGSHAKLLLPTIDRLFRETGLTLKQLDGLVVSRVPDDQSAPLDGGADIGGYGLESQRNFDATLSHSQQSAWGTLLGAVSLDQRGSVGASGVRTGGYSHDAGE
jgi:hypothetical protein